jgi:hypothetical protein
VGVTGLAHRSGPRRLADQREDGLGERAGVHRGHQEPGRPVLHQLGRPAEPGGDHGLGQRAGLDHQAGKVRDGRVTGDSDGPVHQVARGQG